MLLLLIKFALCSISCVKFWFLRRTLKAVYYQTRRLPSLVPSSLCTSFSARVTWLLTPKHNCFCNPYNCMYYSLYLVPTYTSNCISFFQVASCHTSQNFILKVVKPCFAYDISPHLIANLLESRNWVVSHC